MKTAIIISIAFIVSISVLRYGQEVPNNYKKAYDYIVEMPDFMKDFPSLGSDVGGRWEWWSKDGKIGAAHSIATYPRKIMDSPEALNKGVEEYKDRKTQNRYLFEMSPKFIKAGEKRYLYEKRNGNEWEFAIAEETPDRKCTIAVFWFHGSKLDRASALLKAMRSGDFGAYSKSFYRGCQEQSRDYELRKAGRLVIELHKGGEIIFKGKEISASDLKQLCQDWVRKMNEEPYKNKAIPRLHLRAHKKCKMEDIKFAVKAAAEGGMEDVIFGAFVPD